MFYDIIGLVLAIFAFTTTVGLPFAVASSLQSGKLQCYRAEESMARYVLMLVISVIDAAAIWILLSAYDVPMAIILSMALTGICSFASWIMFSKGTMRGENLCQYDLHKVFEKIDETLQTLSDTGSKIIQNHQENAQNMQDNIQNIGQKLAQKLDVDKKIQSFVYESVQKEVEWHVSSIYETEEKILEKIEKHNGELVDKLYDLLERKIGIKKETGTSSKSEDDDAHNAKKPELDMMDYSTTLSESQKSQKILGMITIDLSQYRPKAHKLCIAIHNLLKNRRNNNTNPDGQPYRPNLSDVSGVSGVNKGDVKSRLQELANFGMVTMQKGTSRIEFGLSDMLDRIFNPVLENQREGGMESFYLIQKAKEHHLARQCYFETLKQDISIEQPDAIAIPHLDNESFNIMKAMAIEIETPQEIRSHPEQVKTNMIKNLDTFCTVEMWCYQESADALQNIKENLGVEQRLQIKIMPVQKDGSQA